MVKISNRKTVKLCGSRVDIVVNILKYSFLFFSYSLALIVSK